MTFVATSIIRRWALVACFVLSVSVESSAETRETGSSNSEVRREALAAIPYRLLRSSQARKVHQVVSRPSVYRRLPVKTIDCDHEMFTFLVRNPDVVVGIWKKMGVTKLSMARRGDYAFDAVDGMGTHSTFQLLYGAPRVHLYHGTGYYEGQLLKKRLYAECVLLIRTAYRRTSQGRLAITNVLDVFVKVDNGALDLAAKTLYPLFIRTADENLVTTANFLSQLSYTAEMNSPQVSGLAGQLPQVAPDVRARFAEVVEKVSHRRNATQPQRILDAQRRTRTTPSVADPSRYQPPIDVPNQRDLKVRPMGYHTGSVTISRFPPDFPRYR
jgi:hypothetical protein